MRQTITPPQLPAVVKNYLKLSEQNNKSVSIAPGVVIDESAGAVTIGAGSKICHGAVIQGPVVIGADCIIGNYAFIRPGCLIGNQVRIGYGTEIKNAVLESTTTIGPQCFISDSVIGKGAYLGAQVRPSNHRLDGKTVHVRLDDEDIDTGCEKLGCYIGPGARLGVQVIILPGRYIAAESTIGPRITIEQNLPKGKYILKQEISCLVGEE